jgi:hypothetical protein
MKYFFLVSMLTLSLLIIGSCAASKKNKNKPCDCPEFKNTKPKKHTGNSFKKNTYISNYQTTIV